MAFKSKCFVLFSVLALSGLLSIECTNGFTLDLIHPDSPLNPFHDPSKSRFYSIREAFHRSQSRAAYIKSRLSGSSKFKSVLKPAPGGYVMKYSIGTPPFEAYGIADTGSDVTWTQCKPCTDCFPQALPMFDPKKSKSYKTAACNSTACTVAGSSAGCSGDNVCQYQVTYGDDSSTIGDVAIDTIILGNASFKNVVFGCGHQNDGTFSNYTSGIVGLGGNAVSIVKQLDKQIGGKFTYCLSPDPTARSHISFGPEATVKGAKAVSTPISKHRQDTFYWLTLESISVGNENLKFKPAPGSTKPSGRRAGGSKQATADGNIIIDSGTTLTLLPPDLYDRLESALKEAIPATPVTDPQGTFGLCYASSANLKVPRIVARFSGADLELSPKGTFVEVEEGLFCSTLISSSDIAIFGNLSEIDYLVGYDLVASTVTFKPTNCSKY